MKRKLLALIFAAFGAVACAFGFSACDNGGGTDNPSGGNPEGSTGGDGHIHVMEHHGMEDATCDKNGNVEYYSCSECGKNFADEEGNKELSDVIIYSEGHKMEFVKEYHESCTEAGILEHWHCFNCDKYFADEEGKTELSDVTAPAVGHKPVFVGGTPVSCTQDGEIEHYNCSVCGKNFSDEECENELENIKIVSDGHNMSYTEETQASCNAGGNIAYYYCSVCEKYFSDFEGFIELNEEEIFTEATGHEIGRNLEHREGYGANCFSDGRVEHYYCYECEKYYLDEACKTEVSEEDLKVPSEGHSIEWVPEQPAGCEEHGVEAHWYCPVCELCFADEEGEQLVESWKLSIAPTGHRFDETKWEHNDNHHWHEVTLCGHTGLQSGYADHDFEGNICRTCGYERTAPSSDKFDIVQDGIIYQWNWDSHGYTLRGVESGSTGITSVTIPEEVNYFPLKHIDSNAFQECTSLNEVRISSLAFWNNLSSGYYMTFYSPYTMYVDGAPLEHLVIPEGTTQIGSYANCISIKTVTIEEGVNYYTGLFEGCVNIEKMTLPEAEGNETGSIRLDSLFNGGANMPASLKTVEITGGDKIGTYFFYNLSNVEKIILPATLTEICSSAFWNCTALKNIELPVNLSKIGRDAFNGCVKFTSLVISSNVTEIAENAFKGCSALERISLPAAFNSFGDLFGAAYTDGGIPEPLKEVNLTGALPIAGGAFKNCANIETVNIGGSITSIGNEAFYGCPDLKSVHLSDSVVSLGSSVFSSCGLLDDITLGIGLKSISNYAFSGCVSLSNIALGSGIESIGAGAFGYSGLTSITIPEKVKTIEPYTFQSCLSLATVDLGTVENIGDSSFSKCAFTEIDFPASIKTVGGGVFEGCDLLDAINIPSIEAWLGISFNTALLRVANKLNVGGELLTELKLPLGQKSVTKNAFAGYTLLTSIEFPAGFEKVENYAFDGCEGLTAIYADSIEDWCAMDCWDNPLEYAHNLYINGELLTDLVIPESIREIKYLRFVNCTPLKSVKAEGSIEIVDDNAFYGCTSLKEVDFGSNLKTVGVSVFYGCTSIEKISMPAVFGLNSYVQPSRTGMFVNLFDSYTTKKPDSLKTVNITGGTELAAKAFMGFASLQTITIADSVTKIGYGAFNGCSGLTSIKLPFLGAASDDAQNAYLGYNFCKSGTLVAGDNTDVPATLKTVELTQISVIGDKAFYNCPEITRIIIPDGVTEIGISALQGCTSLEEIDLTESVIKVGESAFTDCQSLAIDLDLSENASVGDNAFKGCVSIKTVQIAASLPTDAIGQNAFNACNVENLETPMAFCDLFDKTRLKSLKLLDGETIEAEAFRDCTELESVELPEGITSIGSYAFSGCQSLGSINIPDGTLSVGEYAFNNCTSLLEISFPSSVDTVQDYALWGCYALTAYYASDYMYKDWGSKWNVVAERQGAELVRYTCASAFVNFKDKKGYYYIIIDGVRYAYKDTGDTAEIAEQASSNTNIYIPATITTLGGRVLAVSAVREYAFYGLNSLESITVDSKNNYFKSLDGIMYDRNMENVVHVPLSIRGEVTIPFEFTAIPQEMFKNCSKLEGVILPEEIKSIGSEAFCGCSSLKSIVLPEAMKEISSWAFKNCSSLKNVNIPAKVSYVYSNAFIGCTSLESIDVAEGNTQYFSRDGVLYSTHNETVCCVPLGIKSVTVEYGWTVNEGDFAGCDKLEKVVFNAVSIYGNVFENCTALKEIILGDKCHYIKANAFKGCTALEKVFYIPDELNNRINVDSEGNGCYKNATLYRYEEVKPDYEGNFWHYADDGVTPVIWE